MRTYMTIVTAAHTHASVIKLLLTDPLSPGAQSTHKAKNKAKPRERTKPCLRTKLPSLTKNTDLHKQSGDSVHRTYGKPIGNYCKNLPKPTYKLCAQALRTSTAHKPYTQALPTSSAHKPCAQRRAQSKTHKGRTKVPHKGPAQSSLYMHTDFSLHKI